MDALLLLLVFFSNASLHNGIAFETYGHIWRFSLEWCRTILLIGLNDTTSACVCVKQRRAEKMRAIQYHIPHIYLEVSTTTTTSNSRVKFMRVENYLTNYVVILNRN
ncbi:hypothetical protein B9Z55_014054 [Caenorhabditis nigoni]|uniref:Secreted protein n=1 Tax=Caenorhabditis nigoni TaxID=1611254 RepID=A0A2G5U4B5_9PELO|nr:hypothetical protein B9Z55_014054 [Caenorhabditis nigoni]